MLKKIIVAALIVTSAVFAQIGVGGRAAVNYGTVWGDHTDEVKGGFGFNAGAAAKIDILPLITFVPGVEVELRRVSADAVFYDEFSYSFWYLDFPLLARFNIIPMFFADAGLNIGFNLVASQTTKISGESKTEDVENVKTVDVGMVLSSLFFLCYRILTLTSVQSSVSLIWLTILATWALRICVSRPA